MESKPLVLNKISKVYTDKVGYKIHLLENISFEMEEKEFLSILAPKGSGKSSLLKIITKLEEPTGGTIESKGKSIFIPSKPSSFPWLNVAENIKYHSNKTDNEIKEIIDLVGLTSYEDHYPHNKSEGFRFRIVLGRALAHDPKFIVIDEPFNNLNSVTRTEIYSLLRNIYNSTQISIILGTTNISEAIFLTNKILLMKKNPGEIIDVVSIKLPADRNVEIMEKDDFIMYRSKIEDIFKQKIDRQLYNFSI